MHPNIPVRKITPSKDTLKHKQRTEMTRTSSTSLQVKTRRLKCVQHNQQQSGKKLLGNKYLIAYGWGSCLRASLQQHSALQKPLKPKGVALQMLRFKYGTQSENPNCWERLLARKNHWRLQIGSGWIAFWKLHIPGWKGFEDQRCSDSLWAAAHPASLTLQVITPHNQIWDDSSNLQYGAAQGPSHNDLAKNAEEKPHRD